MTLNDWAFQQTRTISGMGILLPTVASVVRWSRIFVDVIRLPSTDFFNGKWNPPRSEYAKITFMSDGYVWREFTLNYQRQVWDIPIVQTEGFLAPYLQCRFDFIDEYLASIANTVGAPAPALIPANELSLVQPPLDEIRFSCRDDTAIQVQEYVLLRDVACGAATWDTKSQNSPSNVEPSVPPGTPISVSEPYFPPDDDGNTVPFSQDDFPQPIQLPVGNTCQPLALSVRLTFSDSSEELINVDRWGPINSTTFSCAIGSCTAFLFDRGPYNNGLDPCDGSVGQKFLVSRPSPPQMTAVDVMSAVPI